MNRSTQNAETIFQLLVISALGILVYSNTLSCSFQFDDKLNIVDNPLIRNIENMWPPSGARWFGFLTFSLNYMAGGLDQTGYHLVNIGIHILTALSVYLLIRLTFVTPYLKLHSDSAAQGCRIAFVVALLFAVHPIQTQAVTYIVQRFSSLVALLFILSIDFYILARLAGRERKSVPASGKALVVWRGAIMYLLAAFSALLCIKTKENGYTLPIVAVIYDLMFLGSLPDILAILKKRLRTFISLSVAVLALLGAIASTSDIPWLFGKLRATFEISRHDYLITQFRVVVTYIRLMLFPVGQTIDHHYRVYSNLFEPAVFGSLILLLLLLLLAVRLLMLSGEMRPYLRLVSFGIFWFFITLSIESSFIPIVDVMFEHRLYLPGVGAILAVTAAVVHLLDGAAAGRRQMLVKWTVMLFAAIIFLFSCAAYARNRVWQNELTLWSDAAAKKPDNPRAYNMLGMYCQSHFRIYDATGYYIKALEVDGSYAEARSNLGVAYIQTGRIDDGLNELRAAARSNRFDAIDTGILYYNIGRGYYLKGLLDQAAENLNLSLYYSPNEAATYSLLGEVFRRKNLGGQSADYFNKARNLSAGRY